MRLSYADQETQMLFAETVFLAFEGGIEVALKLNKNETAFVFAEKGKAGALRQLFQHTTASKLAGITDSLLTIETNLRHHITTYEKKIQDIESEPAAERDSARLAIFKNALFQYNRQKDTIQHIYKTKYPKYNELINNTTVASVQDVQEYLTKHAPKSACIEYFAGDSALYCFAITPNGIETATIDNDSLFEYVEALRRNIFDFQKGYAMRHDSFVDIATLLYKKLLKPIEKSIAGKDLIIIRDGILDLIPFETLLATNQPDTCKTTSSYANLPYLIHKHGVNYALSATLLLQSANKHETMVSHKGHEFLAMAPVFGNLESSAISNNKEIADAIPFKTRFMGY